MRFMILIKSDANTEAGVLPSEELLTEMGKFNEELVTAGVLLAGEGLHPSSKDEAIAWVKRVPAPLEGDAEIEIRQVFQADDFGDALTPELREAEDRLRAQAAANGGK